MKLKAIVHEAEEGGYWAEIPALPGCVTQADTLEQLQRNLHEAAQGWLLAAESSSQATDGQSDGQVLEVAV